MSSLEHYCYCGKWGSFGYGERGIFLIWYCTKHCPKDEPPRVVECSPLAMMLDAERENT